MKGVTALAVTTLAVTALGVWVGLFGASAGASPNTNERADWQPVSSDAGLPSSVEMRRSPDRRCSLAVVSANNPGVSADKLTPALVNALQAAGFKTTAEGGFERGNVAGTYVAAPGEDTGRATWHLRACFYRKRDANVCQSSCKKLL